MRKRSQTNGATSGRKRNSYLAPGGNPIGSTPSLLLLLLCGILAARFSDSLQAAWTCPSAPRQASNLPAMGEGKQERLPAPERGSVSGRTYTNEFLGFSYQFPEGWNVRPSEELTNFDANLARKTLEATEAAKRGTVFDTGTVVLLRQWTLLFASPSPPDLLASEFTPSTTPEPQPSGKQQPNIQMETAVLDTLFDNRALPVITLVAEEGNDFQRGEMQSGDKVDKYFAYSDLMQTGELAVAAQYRSYHLARKPLPQTVGGRKFVRADWRIARKGGDLWETRIVTFVKGCFVRLEILTGNRQELDRLAETANSFAFSKEEK
jgi:hypothetical protein